MTKQNPVGVMCPSTGRITPPTDCAKCSAMRWMHVERPELGFELIRVYCSFMSQGVLKEYKGKAFADHRGG